MTWRLCHDMTSWRKSRHIVLHYYHTVNLKAFIVIEIFRAICPYLSIIFVIMSLSVYMSWNGLITWRHTVTSWHENMKAPFLHTPAYFAFYLLCQKVDSFSVSMFFRSLSSKMILILHLCDAVTSWRHVMTSLNLIHLSQLVEVLESWFFFCFHSF